MSRRRRSLLVRTLRLLFFLNFISLSIYFLLHPRPRPPHRTLERLPSSSSLRPWPSLPSFLPWNPTPPPPPRSCEGYFGHGFSRRVELLRPSSSSSAGRGGGWFRCFYSETLASSICEGGRIRMDPSRISMTVGGEELEKVIGRGEEEELPRYGPGAFQIEEGEGRTDEMLADESFLHRYLPRGAIQMHTMRELVGSIRVVRPGELECSQVGDFRYYLELIMLNLLLPENR